jgi:hypothetical protein
MTSYGVNGSSDSGVGVNGFSFSNSGVYGISTSSFGFLLTAKKASLSKLKVVIVV